LALAIFPLLTVIDTWTSPYWVLTGEPVKVPDFPAGALELGGGVGFLVGVLLVRPVVAGEVVGAVEWVTLGLGDAFGVLFFTGAVDADALGEGLAVGEALAVGVAGVVLATSMPATWVLYENNAARPAAVVPKTTTARRMKPPVND
jgi:hypothetical protein